MPNIHVLCVVGLLTYAGTSAGAQAELQGRVFADSGRRRVWNAEVAIPRLNLSTLSDSPP